MQELKESFDAFVTVTSPVIKSLAWFCWFIVMVAVDGVGDGYNSKDYHYRFFEVTDFADTSPATWW